MISPNYYFASLLRREKQEERENTEEHSFLTFRRTNKQGTEFSFKKKKLQKETCFSKNIAFLWRRECTKKEKFFKSWVYRWKEKGKTIRKKGWDFSKRSFFFFQKSWKDKKKQEMRKTTKKNQTTIATRRKDKEQEKCAQKKKKKNKTKRTEGKMVKKRRWKETKSEKSKRKTQTGERIKKRKEEKRMKKGIHKKRCLKKEAREIFKKCKKKKTRMNTFFRKERTPFLLTKRFQLKIKAEKNISCFFKIKGKVDQKNTFYKERFKRTLFFLFSFWCFFFDKKTKEEKQNSWWNMWELIEEEWEF